MNNLLNISPIDGRYNNVTKELNSYLSEYALIKYRVLVEIKWLIYIIEKNIIKESITEEEKNNLLNINNNFNLEEAEIVKEIENTTKHDVKAIEYYLQRKLKEINLERLISYIHITLTSEDINNVSYNLMIKDTLNNIYFEKIENLLAKLNELSKLYSDTPMLAHTHGQNATPTTLGKEFKVFEYRILSIYKLLKNLKLRSKFSGAVGNYNCHVITFRDIDWIDESKNFIESLDLEYNPVTTQIESHDILCIMLSYIKVINNIIKDLNSDMWLYISRNYLIEKANKNEVGSSVMPHKVNPINHENSMANIEISNSIIDALVNNLSISRMQRDLSDSSKLRNLGVIFGHILVSVNQTMIGLNKINVNKEYLEKELEENYNVLAEGIQTILRKNNIENAYELLKELSRGKETTKETIEDFINNLDINKEDKEILLNLKPSNYIGLASIIANTEYK